jgi:hypothetical protein
MPRSSTQGMPRKDAVESLKQRLAEVVARSQGAQRASPPARKAR